MVGLVSALGRDSKDMHRHWWLLVLDVYCLSKKIVVVW